MQTRKLGLSSREAEGLEFFVLTLCQCGGPGQRALKTFSSLLTVLCSGLWRGTAPLQVHANGIATLSTHLWCQSMFVNQALNVPIFFSKKGDRNKLCRRLPWQLHDTS